MCIFLISIKIILAKGRSLFTVPGPFLFSYAVDSKPKYNVYYKLCRKHETDDIIVSTEDINLTLFTDDNILFNNLIVSDVIRFCKKDINYFVREIIPIYCTALYFVIIITVALTKYISIYLITSIIKRC